MVRNDLYSGASMRYDRLRGLIGAGIVHGTALLSGGENAGLSARTQTAVLAMADEDKEDETDRGWVWNVELIRAGEALANYRFFYEDELLKESYSLFEGVSAYMHRGGQHMTWSDSRSEQDKCGWYDGVNHKNRVTTAKLNILKNRCGTDLRAMLMDAFDRGKKDIVGLSAHLKFSGKYVDRDGKLFMVPTEIHSVVSVDVVGKGATGAKFISMMSENNEEDFQMREQLLALLRKRRPDLYATIDSENVTDDALLSLCEQALGGDGNNGNTGDDPPHTPPATDPSTEGDASVQAQIALLRESNARSFFRATLSESNLPESFQKEAQTQFDALMSGNVVPEEEAITGMVARLRSLAANANPPPNPASRGRIEIGDEERDKHLKAMIGMLSLRGERVDNVEPFLTLRHAYATLAAGRHNGIISPEDVIREAQFMPGLLDASDEYRQTMRESYLTLATTDLGELLGDALHRQVIQHYSQENLQNWREVVSNITTITDFRDHRRIRFGGYGLLPEVPENSIYQYLDSPSDEEESFSVAKYGGMEKITMEMISNDDIGALRSIPMRMGRASALTINNLIFGLFTTPQIMADGLPAFHVSHNNLISAALSQTSMRAAWVTMSKQRPYGIEDEQLMMGNKPKKLLIPAELEPVAEDLKEWKWETGTENRNRNAFMGQIDCVPVARWSDPNDWALLSDPMMNPTIEIGFYNGQQEPQVLMADMPTSHSYLRTDNIDLRVRIIAGVVMLEWRTAYLSRVA